MQTSANEPEKLVVPETLIVNCFSNNRTATLFTVGLDVADANIVVNTSASNGMYAQFTEAVIGPKLKILLANADQLAKLTAENERLKDDITHAVKEAKKRDPDYPWTQETASEAVWALGEGKLGIEAACDDWQKQLTAERDAALSLLRRSTPFLGGWVGYQEVRDDIEAFLQQFDGNGNGQGTLTAGGE